MSRHFIRKPITNLEEGQEYLALLQAHRLLYHLEDNPAEVLWADSCIPPDWIEMANMRQRAKELYALEWEDYGCPIGFCLYLMREADQD